MEHDDLVYIGHMLDVTRTAASILDGVTREQFDASVQMRLAITHLVQTFGEAARAASATFQSDHPEIPWAKVIATRNRIVHEYLGVDDNVIWRVAVEEFPRLVPVLEALESGRQP